MKDEKKIQEYELLDVTNTKWARTFFTRPNEEVSLHVFFTTMQPNITVGHIGSPKQTKKEIMEIKWMYVNTLKKKIYFISKSQVKYPGYHFQRNPRWLLLVL